MKFDKLINAVLSNQLHEAYNISYAPSEERIAYAVSVYSEKEDKWVIYPVSQVQFDDGVSQWYNEYNALYRGESFNEALQVFASTVKGLMPNQPSTFSDVLDAVHKLPNLHERGLWTVGDESDGLGGPFIYIGVEPIPAKPEEGIRDISRDDTSDEEGNIMDL